jgi:hypothetical protein
MIEYMRANQAGVFVLLLLSTLLLSSPLFAQDEVEDEGVTLPLWTIEAHDPDPAIAQEQIADMIEEGMLPVGIERRPGRPTIVLYSLNLGNPVREVALYTFEDLSRVNSDVRALIDQGFAPVGVSRHEQGLTMLFLRGGQDVGQWGIVEAPLNLTEIESTFADLAADGFAPWGMTVWNESMLVLALEEPARESERSATIQLYNFDPTSYTPGVSAAMKEGLYPWGIAVNGPELYVQYTREAEVGEE